MVVEKALYRTFTGVFGTGGKIAEIILAFVGAANI